MSEIEAKYFVRAFVRFLHKQIDERKFSADIVESLEVAAQCLETAYDLPSSSPDNDNSGGGEGASSELDDSHPLGHIDTYELFLNTCNEVSPERKLEAENVKNEGNCLMKEEKYHEALKAYNKAIGLDATNPVFYCNRAAAFSRLGDYQRAAEDCKMSLRYDPTYSKAYGRMGIAYSKLNKHGLALEAYQNALRLDPDNVDYQNNMSVTQQRLDESLNPTATPAAGNINIPGAGAGFPNLGGIDFGASLNAALNSQELMSLATRMMNDPQMQEMVSNIRDTSNMSALLETGRQLVTRLRTENPEEFSNVFMDAQAQLDPNSRSGPDGESNNTEPKNQQQQPPPPNPPQ